MNRTVVVSGASSGIGYAIALRLHGAGYRVIGLSRTLPKKEHPFLYVTADIADETSVRQAAIKILETDQNLFALINCAGMGISGAAEYTDLAQAKRLFDVNLFGTFSLTKALLPALRAGRGRILNISSVAAELAIPFQAFYSMSKAAIDVFTETLRLELRPFGVQVASVLPGDTATGFTANREKSPIEVDQVYGDRIQRSVARMETDERQGMNPDTVARVCEKLLKRRRMPISVAVGFQYKLFLALKWLLPRRLVEWVLYQMYGK